MDAPCCDVFRLVTANPVVNCYPSGTVMFAQLGVLSNIGKGARPVHSPPLLPSSAVRRRSPVSPDRPSGNEAGLRQIVGIQIDVKSGDALVANSNIAEAPTCADGLKLERLPEAAANLVKHRSMCL